MAEKEPTEAQQTRDALKAIAAQAAADYRNLGNAQGAGSTPAPSQPAPAPRP